MSTHPHSPARLSRREILKLLGTTAASAVLAACTPAVTPTAGTSAPATSPPKSETATVVIMHRRAELSEEDEAKFEADNPGIQIELIADDFTRFFALYAAGTPPDLMRVQAPSVPQFLARKLLKDLTPYFEASTLLKPDDFSPANSYYKANSPLEIGQGNIYGMCKDWSPDFTLYAYKPAFEAAGVAVPDPSKPLTYAEVLDLARQTATFEGDRITTWGFDYDAAWVDRIWMNLLAEKDQGLYADSFTKMNLTGNDEARKVTQYFFDLAKEKLTTSPVNPSPSWIGEDFTKGQVSLLQYGYWFSAMAESEVTKDQVVMLPAATWSGVRRDPTMTATGMIMAAATQVPDAAWKVFEWYNGGDPSVARAKSGWGVPALKSMYDLVPTDTDFQKQANGILQGELPHAETPLQFNPYIGESTVADAWTRTLEQALRGEITFDELLANVESEVNVAIKEGIDRLS